MKQRFLFLLSFATLLGSPQAGFGQAPPPLGAAASFALFTAVGAVENSGPTIINGDIGTNAGAFNGFPPGVINGNIYVADTYATQAATDVQTAYSYFSSNIPCVSTLAVYGGTPPVTLGPGSYCVGGASTLAGTLILDAGGDATAKFYLRVTGALTTGANSLVLLQNGASINNVYWQIGGQVTLGQNSTMRGTLLVDGAINMIQGATLLGRGLSRAGAITIDTNTATAPDVIAVPAATSTTWLGNRTIDWYTTTNWSAGVPTATVNAVVPIDTSPYPVIANRSAATLGLSIATGASLTLGGGTLDVKGNVNNAGTISATAGVVSFSGTNSQIIGGSGSTQLWSLSVANPKGLIQSQAVRIHGVLAPAGGNLNTNRQSLTLLSDATGTALVDNTGIGSVNGNATVQRYIDPSLNAGAGYRHFSAPVSNTTVADLATAGFSPEVRQAAVYNASATPGTTPFFPTVFGYDQTRVTLANNYAPFDRGFVVPAALTTPLAVGQGYAVNIDAAQLVDFVGTLNNGDLTLPLSRVADNADAGWQLLGNPYPAPLDYSRAESPDRANLDAAMYVYSSTGPYVGNYRSYLPPVDGNPGIGNPILPVAQGFFVRVSTGQTSGSITFRNSQRLTAPDATAFQRPAADARPLVQLELRGRTGPADALYAYAQAGATPAFDTQYDAAKLANPTGLNLSSTATSGEALAIDGRPVFAAATALLLSVGVPAAGTYTLSAVALNHLPAGLNAYLRDAQTGQMVNLRTQPAYTFTVTAAQATALLTSRFTLQFSASALATTAGLTAAEVTLYPNPAHNAFTVLVPAVAGATQVHADLLNSLGQVVRRQEAPFAAAGARLAVDATGLAAGIYTLRLQVGAATLAKRVVIQ